MAINLNQLNNGKWKACGPALQNHSVIIEHDTPEEALRAAEAFLECYELFLDMTRILASIKDETIEAMPESAKLIICERLMIQAARYKGAKP